jgi:sterol desaturase/sphingolipid hydroxylase (fatty acid hydroxylase superfamily)
MSNKTSDEHYSSPAHLGHGSLLFGAGFASWRTQKRRRIQVACALAALALYVGGALLGFPVASLFGLALFLAFALLLRITTRGLADLPGSVLDERQLAVRNALYVAAYRVTGGLFALLAIICIGLTWMGQAQISTAAALQTLLGGLFLAFVTPSCLVAWTEREA